MNQKNSLILIILALMFTVSAGAFYYVSFATTDSSQFQQADASSFEESQLQILEQQLEQAQPRENIPSAEDFDLDPELSLESSTAGPQDNSPANPDELVPGDIEIPVTQAGGEFVNQKEPEIPQNAAQTTVNLRITAPEEDN